MIKFLFLTIPNQYTYEQLKSPISFKQDIYGVTTWTMKHPLTIFSCDLKTKHVFRLNEVKIEAVVNPLLEEKWRYFVITKKDGGKYYCTSQIIYQKAFLRTSTTSGPSSLSQSQFFQLPYQHSTLTMGQQYYLPRCIILISQLPYFKLQVNLLKIHKELKKHQPAISHCIEEELYELYLEYLMTGREKEWQSLNINEIKSKRRIYCSLQVSFAYYVDCCNSHDTGECIYIEKSTSRQVLHLYKLYPSSLYQIGYFFHLPLSATTLRKVISAILTEKQIVFSSSNANLTVMVIQTLMQMILPLKWCYMYAPNLPVQLIQAAQQSFMPFIVGISKQHVHMISPTNKLIVHIDTDEIQYSFEQQQQQLHMLSTKFEKLLHWRTNSNKQYLEWEKQLRINSILLITTIFKKDLPLQKEIKKFESEVEKVSQEKFYQEFLSKSMMYRKLIQDLHEKVYSQFYKLTKMDYIERRNFLINKFNSLHSQTIYPTKIDNKKEWIKFYEKYMRYKRKSRYNRHSLSMVETGLTGVVSYSNLLGVGIPFYASNVSGGGNANNVNVNVNNYINTNNLTNSTIGNRFDASVVTQYNSNLANNAITNSNTKNPTYQPRTPSNITTTSNINNPPQQPSTSSIINKTQYFSNRQNQLYQSSVNPGSIGLKFHLGQNRTPSKDARLGSNLKVKRDSVSTRQLHGMDLESGRISQDEELQQQHLNYQTQQQIQQSSLQQQQQQTATILQQQQQSTIPALQQLPSQSFHSAPNTPSTTNMHQNNINQQIITTQFNPTPINQQPVSGRQYQNYTSTPATTTTTTASSTIFATTNNNNAQNNVSNEQQQLRTSILYQSFIGPVQNNYGLNNNNNNNENISNVGNNNNNVNNNNIMSNNISTSKTNTLMMPGLSRAHNNDEHQPSLAGNNVNSLHISNANYAINTVVGNQYQHLHQHQQQHINNNIYLQHMHEKNNHHGGNIPTYNSSSNNYNNYGHFVSSHGQHQHQQQQHQQQQHQQQQQFLAGTNINNNNTNITPSHYQYQPSYQQTNPPYMMINNMGNNFNGQISQITQQQPFIHNNNTNPNSNSNSKRSQSTILYNNNINNINNMHPMQPYPLNQSVVASYIFPNQNISPSPMNNNTNTNSHRNLPSTQSTAIL